MSASKKGRKPKITYTRVIVNIPTVLTQRFDKVCQREGFSRQEAVKQAIRDFIHGHTSEDDYDPDQVRDAMKNMMLGFADAAKESQLATSRPELPLKK